MTATVHPLQGMFSFCPNGHPLTEDNIYVRANGRECCRTCVNEQQRRYRTKVRTQGGTNVELRERPRVAEEQRASVHLLDQLTALLAEPVEDWQERAVCKETDPEAFFPEKGFSTRPAKRICQGCEVRAECLEFALVTEQPYGIWGGTSARERKKLLREGRGEAA